MEFVLHWLHGTLLRWFWRVLAPANPRGWLDIHAVIEDDTHPSTLWIHCHGMERWGLPNIEFVGVPRDLGGYAHGILLELVGYMKNVKPINAGEDLGGLFVDEQQPAYHLCTLQTAPPQDDHLGFLRVVDINESVEAGFPFRLFAAHLCAFASLARNPCEQERIARQAIHIYDCNIQVTDVPDFDPRMNYNNYKAWELLGEALCAKGQEPEGFSCLEEAVARCPVAAREFSAFIRKQIDEGAIPQPKTTMPQSFYYYLDVDAVTKKVLGKHLNSSQQS